MSSPNSKLRSQFPSIIPAGSDQTICPPSAGSAILIGCVSGVHPGDATALNSPNLIGELFRRKFDQFDSGTRRKARAGTTLSNTKDCSTGSAKSVARNTSLNEIPSSLASTTKSFSIYVAPGAARGVSSRPAKGTAASPPRSKLKAGPLSTCRKTNSSLAMASPSINALVLRAPSGSRPPRSLPSNPTIRPPSCAAAIFNPPSMASGTA